MWHRPMHIQTVQDRGEAALHCFIPIAVLGFPCGRLTVQIFAIADCAEPCLSWTALVHTHAVLAVLWEYWMAQVYAVAHLDWMEIWKCWSPFSTCTTVNQTIRAPLPVWLTSVWLIFSELSSPVTFTMQFHNNVSLISYNSFNDLLCCQASDCSNTQLSSQDLAGYSMAQWFGSNLWYLS